MGAAVSTVDVGILAAKSPSSNGQGVLAVARTINELTLKLFTLTTQREFHLNVNKLNALFPDVAKDAIEQVFAVFDPTNRGVVDSCELLASLVLATPQLSRDVKQKAIFELFNVSTHRVGLMVADEATLLFRTVAMGAAKMLRAFDAITIQDKATNELPPLSFFEDLTKAMYGEQETLACQAFAQLCQDTAEVDAFILPWVHGSEQVATQSS